MSNTFKRPVIKNRVLAEILSWVEVVIIAAAIAFFVNTFLLANSTVPSGSMENTIMPGSRVFGSRLTYKFNDPQRGDIVIFRWPDNEKLLFIKRLIGLPGDTIDIINGKVYLNGSDTPLDEPYLREPMHEDGQAYHFEVPEDCYFFMGDNRNESRDARYWNNTFVKREKLIAKVYYQYFPSFKKLAE